MACGKPVIATDVGGVAEAIQHRESGWLISPRDSKALAGVRRADGGGATRPRGAGAGDQQVLFSIDVASGSVKIIGSKPRDYTPGSNLNPSIRFTLSPDGRSFIFGSGQFKSNLWMLEGFTKTKGPFAALLR
jgi:Glycosyl transferases group 1